MAVVVTPQSTDPSHAAPADPESPRAPVAAAWNSVAPRAADPTWSECRVDVEGEDVLWRAEGVQTLASVTRDGMLALGRAHMRRVWQLALLLCLVTAPAVVATAWVYSHTRTAFVDAGGDPLEPTLPVDMLAQMSRSARVPFVLLTTGVTVAFALLHAFVVGMVVEYWGGRVSRRTWAGVALMVAVLAVSQLWSLVVQEPSSGALGLAVVLSAVAVVGVLHVSTRSWHVTFAFVCMTVANTITTAVLAYWAVPVFFAAETSEVTRVLLRLVAVPALFEFALCLVRAFTRVLVRAHTGETTALRRNPGIVYATFMISQYSIITRLMTSSMTTASGAAVAVIGAGVLEVALRLSIRPRDALYFTPVYGRARANDLMTRPSARVIQAEMHLVDAVTEATGIGVALTIVLAFRLQNMSIFGALLTALAQFGMEIVVDAIPLLFAWQFAPWPPAAPRNPRLAKLGAHVRRGFVNGANLLSVHLKSRLKVALIVYAQICIAFTALAIVLMPGEHFCAADTGPQFQENRPC